MASVWDESEVRGSGGGARGSGRRGWGAGRAGADAAVVPPQDGVGEEVLKMSTEEIVQRTRLLDSEIKVAAGGRRPGRARKRWGRPREPGAAGARGGLGDSREQWKTRCSWLDRD